MSKCYQSTIFYWGIFIIVSLVDLFLVQFIFQLPKLVITLEVPRAIAIFTLVPYGPRNDSVTAGSP